MSWYVRLSSSTTSGTRASRRSTSWPWSLAFRAGRGQAQRSMRTSASRSSPERRRSWSGTHAIDARCAAARRRGGPDGGRGRRRPPAGRRGAAARRARAAFGGVVDRHARRQVEVGARERGAPGCGSPRRHVARVAAGAGDDRMPGELRVRRAPGTGARRSAAGCRAARAQTPAAVASASDARPARREHSRHPVALRRAATRAADGVARRGAGGSAGRASPAARSSSRPTRRCDAAGDAAATPPLLGRRASRAPARSAELRFRVRRGGRKAQLAARWVDGGVASRGTRQRWRLPGDRLST